MLKKTSSLCWTSLKHALSRSFNSDVGKITAPNRSWEVFPCSLQAIGGQCIGLGEVCARPQGSARQGGTGGNAGDVPHSALHRSPVKGGSRKAEWQEKAPLGRGESVVSGPWISSRWIIPRRVSGRGARTELGSVTGWGTWQYHTVIFSFWLSVSSWLDFAQAKCRTVKRKRCLHQTLSNVSQTPVLLPLLKQILCWDWRTEIADLVYPQNQCSPEAVDGTSGVLRLWKSQIPLCPCKIFGSGVNYYQV